MNTDKFKDTSLSKIKKITEKIGISWEGAVFIFGENALKKNREACFEIYVLC